MATYWDQMFNTTGTSTSLADMNAGITASTGPFRPRAGSKLMAVKVLLSGTAATSLVAHVRIELNCTLWSPNLMRLGYEGAHLLTAPANAGNNVSFVDPVDQPVDKVTDILGQYILFDSPVTPRILVFGLFQV